MDGANLKSRATVSAEMWESHIVKRLQKGCTIIVWPKRAVLKQVGQSTSPCPMAVVKFLLASGRLEKLGLSVDGDGTIYCLKEEWLELMKQPKKRKPRRKIKLDSETPKQLLEKAKVSEDDEDDFDEIDTDEDSSYSDSEEDL